jgi:V8-like Glu-specific endopeptidase
MGWGRRRDRWAITALMLAALATGSALGGMALASTGGPPPAIGVTSAVSTAAQQAARAFWTPARMAAATPVANLSGVIAGPAVSPPPGTPTARPFNGVPTVGALFFTNQGLAHYCTASVIISTPQDMVLTAAHCVYSGGYFKNIEFIPGYHSGRMPHGAWAVKAISVAAGWVRGSNASKQNFDFAFLAVTPPPGTSKPIQQVTGALRLGINRPFMRPIEVIGYNSSDSRPVECATHSLEFEPTQIKFYCHDYRDGTSGSPWIVRYNSSNGTGVVIGTIGGYQLGGIYDWESYSAYLGNACYQLYLLAER